MPNIKSAEKRVKIIEKKTLENKAIKSKISTYIKKFKLAVANKDIPVAEVTYKDVVSLLDKAACDNVIHKNNASRKVARLYLALNNAKLATVGKQPETVTPVVEEKVEVAAPVVEEKPAKKVAKKATTKTAKTTEVKAEEKPAKTTKTAAKSTAKKTTTKTAKAEEKTTAKKTAKKATK